MQVIFYALFAEIIRHNLRKTRTNTADGAENKGGNLRTPHFER